MYSISDVLTALKNPHRAAREVNRLVNYRREEETPYHGTGVDVMRKDWDNLFILDACRFDDFASQSTLPGETKTITSRGSTTPEFIAGNFVDESWKETVYVTANPQVTRLRDRNGAEIEFYEEYNLFEERHRDEETNSIRPEVVAEGVREANKKNPNKRIIAHFIQPHTPYIGPTGRDLNTGDLSFDWQELRKSSKDDWKRARKAYRENLDIALDEVEQLLSSIDGKTVVTSDHGEMFGERLSPIPIRNFGHPRGVYEDELIEVPWHVCPYEGRREIVEGNPRDQAEVDNSTVDDQLRYLGYR